MANNEFDNFDETIKKLNEFNGDSTPIEEVLNDQFMSDHTNFSDLQSFFDTCEITVEDIKNENISKLDPLVKANSEFDDWQDMINNAGEEYIFNKLDL